MAMLGTGRVLVYTCARHYVEAGAAVSGESLRAGTPVAALAWRKGTCAQAALCDNTGTVALISPQADDNAAASVLADAIEQAALLKPAGGFLTAFVNVSCVLPIRDTSEHAQILDTWLTALSRLGLHARHLEIYGAARTWHRREVEGITLRIAHDGLEISDIVLLWNASRPSFMATDLGSGLERLRWAITRRAWPSVVYGSLAERADPFVLDTIRAATLIAANGILPNDSGPGNGLRRLARSIPAASAALGLSAAVRSAYAYWSLASPLQLPWPEVCQILDEEASRTSCR